MDVLSEWLDKAFVNVERKKVRFDITDETLSVSLFLDS